MLEVTPAHFICFSCKLNFFNIGQEKKKQQTVVHPCFNKRKMHAKQKGKPYISGINLLCCYFCMCQQVVLKCSVVVEKVAHTKWTKKQCLERICFAFWAVGGFALQSVFKLGYKTMFISKY